MSSERQPFSHHMRDRGREEERKEIEGERGREGNETEGEREE